MPCFTWVISSSSNGHCWTFPRARSLKSSGVPSGSAQAIKCEVTAFQALLYGWRLDPIGPLPDVSCVTEFRFLQLDGRYLRTLDRLDCLALLLSHRFESLWLALIAKLSLGSTRLRQSLIRALLEVQKLELHRRHVSHEKWRAQHHTLPANTCGC